MNQARLICMIVMAGAVAIGCGTEEAGSANTNGTGATGGSGATGGTGATGGVGDGACTNEADAAIYAEADYTNDDGSFTGVEAISELGGDCVFGTAPNLVSDGCGDEVGAVLGNNNPTTRQALATCVEVCIVEQGYDLSEDCLSCYGATVSCGAAFCASECVGGTDLPGCISCRCGNNSESVNCTGDFDTCSGLPSSGDCN